MDPYDGCLWFSDPPPGLSTTTAAVSGSSPSATTPAGCLSSPSSGYSSSDEGRATPLGEAGWAPDLILSSDPYLGELVMTPGCATVPARRAAPAACADPGPTSIAPGWSSGSSLVLDDLVDTLWDSLSAGGAVDDACSTRAPADGNAQTPPLLSVTPPPIEERTIVMSVCVCVCVCVCLSSVIFATTRPIFTICVHVTWPLIKQLSCFSVNCYCVLFKERNKLTYFQLMSVV